MAGAHRPDVTAIPLGRPSPGASSNQPERQANGQGPAAFEAPRVAPIRFCSRRGLPCRRRCRLRGALLPHPFTLTVLLDGRPAAIRRFAFCGAFPGVAPAGRYPAPHPYGARTFLRFEAAFRTGSLWHIGYTPPSTALLYRHSIAIQANKAVGTRDQAENGAPFLPRSNPR